MMQTLRPGRQHQLLRLELSKHGAPSGCMFSVLKAPERQVGSGRKTKRPMFDLYSTAVTSFVESYIAANQIYPKISKVMQTTGGSRYTIKRILNELKIGKNAASFEEDRVKGQDSMTEMDTNLSQRKCLPSVIINVEDSAMPYSDKFEQSVEEVVSAQVEVAFNSTGAEKNNERIGTSVPNLEGKGFSVFQDPTLLRLLDQAMHSSNKAGTDWRVAPLMDVLQQKSSGSSRRVHLSDCGGIGNNLSWEKTLQSIMPTSVVSKEDKSGLKNEQPEVNRQTMVHQFEDKQRKANGEKPRHLSLSSEGCKESTGTVSNSNLTIKVISSKVNSVLSHTSGLRLVAALKQEAEVFKDLKSIRFFRTMVNTNPYAILSFKKKESVRKALKLKNVIILGECLCLQNNLTKGVTSQPTTSGESSVFEEVMQGMAGSLNKEDMSSKSLHSLSDLFAEDKQSDECMQGQHGLSSSYLQTISIQRCPNNVSLESIASFFSVFGKVQTSYGVFNHGVFSYGKSPVTPIFVEFEREGDKEKAMKVQKFIVDGCTFQLRPPPTSTVVLLKCEVSKSLKFDKAAVIACKQYGVVEMVSLKSAQLVEVKYRAIERHRIDELLKSLREDTYFKGRWDILPVYEGYIKADLEPTWYKENVKNILIVLNELSTYLTSLLHKDS